VKGFQGPWWDGPCLHLMERSGEHWPVAVWWEMLMQRGPRAQGCTKVGRESLAASAK